MRALVTTMLSVIGTLAIILYLNPLTALVTAVLLLVSFIIYKQIQASAYKRGQNKELRSQHGSIELAVHWCVDFISVILLNFFNQHCRQSKASECHPWAVRLSFCQELNNAVIAVFQAIVFLLPVHIKFSWSTAAHIVHFGLFLYRSLGSITLMEFGMAYQSITVSLNRIEQILDLPQESVGTIVPSDDVNQIPHKCVFLIHIPIKYWWTVL